MRDVKISEHLISEGGAPIPDSRVEHSLTNLGFNELPHSTNQNISPVEIGEYGPPFNLTNSRFNELYCDCVRVRIQLYADKVFNFRCMLISTMI